jgi:prephenate dehydrogenase
MRIAVLGVGLIGGSIGLSVRHSGSASVAGYDSDPATLAAAVEREAIDTAAASVAEAVVGADVCFACAPVGALPALVGEALELAGPECAVTDVGSTKRSIIDAVSDQRFIGGHPIAGSEAAGVGGARADLFEGATWYLTPIENSSGVLYGRLHKLLVALGARPVAIDADAHDRLLAAVSHLPHVLANVLVDSAGTVAPADSIPRVGPSFRDATRVAGANSAIWTDIYLSNARAIAAAIDEGRERLAEVAGMLRAGDSAGLTEWNERAREQRKRLLDADLPGGPVQELRVIVPNRAGVLAELALSLGRGGVNIVDMALAPAPDNRSGAISFWIAGERAAARARELIERLGFPVAQP